MKLTCLGCCGATGQTWAVNFDWQGAVPETGPAGCQASNLSSTSAPPNWR